MNNESEKLRLKHRKCAFNPVYAQKKKKKKKNIQNVCTVVEKKPVVGKISIENSINSILIFVKKHVILKTKFDSESR